MNEKRSSEAFFVDIYSIPVQKRVWIFQNYVGDSSFIL